MPNLVLKANPHRKDAFFLTTKDGVIKLTLYPEGHQVKLVFDAPKSVVIDREKIHLKKEAARS